MNLLHQKNGLLTDNYFQEIQQQKPYIYCFGRVRKGDYLVTCPLKGIAKVTGMAEGAFAVSDENNDNANVKLIKVRFLPWKWKSVQGVLVIENDGTNAKGFSRFE